MGHSSDVHKLILSDDGIELVPMDAAAEKKMVGKSISGREKMTQG
jgi:hypothetical protein